MVRRVPTEHLTDINILYERDKSDLTPRLIAAWSMVLYQFVNSEALYLGVDAPKEKSGGIISDMQTFAVIIDPECPIEQLLHSNHQLSVSQGESGNVCFNTGVAFTTGDSGNPLGSETSKSQLPSKDNQDCDILLIAKACNKTVEILLEYSTAVVSDQQAAIIGGVVLRAMESLFECPKQKLREIDLLDQQSKENIAAWNNKETDVACYSSVAEIIQEKSRCQPDAQAVCSWDGCLTYGELEEVSTRLATYLTENGAGPEVMVPVCFEKTIWAIVATLAVLKTGAAFVPMDPSHPLERLKQIIAQVNAKVIVSSDRHAALLERITDNIIAVSETMAARLPTDDQKALPHAEPHHVAYVLFTSGSTGIAKGCVVEHRALAAVAGHGEALHIGASTRVLQFASFSFGVSLNEIFCTLTAGGAVCIPSDHERMNDLPGAMRRMEVDWALLTPSLMSSIEPESLASLKTLAVAGEPMSSDLAHSWTGRVHLVLAYGLTEWAGICTAQHELSSAAANPRSIGKSPSANLWLVNPDNHNVLAPIGAVAELLIEGPCLAREYLNDPERTAMGFIENPPWLRLFRPDRQARIYKTGDLVRYSSNGNLIYIGRKSMQAKIRGQRIELGEVEHHVYRQFAGATKVIVDMVVPSGDNPSSILVAFICFKDDRMRQNEDIHSHPAAIFDGSDRDFQACSAKAYSNIRDYLPDYMIPHVYVPLKYVPLTITGKVDRRRLKEVAGSLSYETLASYTHTRSELVAPSTSAEQRLHRLVAETLKLPSESFGVNESFFRLGGDSLKAMQLVTRCRREGVSITVQDIFREKSVGNLAMLMSSERHVPLSGAGDKEEAEFSLSAFQQNMIQAEEQGVHLSTTRVFLRFNRRVEPARLENAIRKVVDRHPMLRARFKRDRNGVWIQCVSNLARWPQGGYFYTNCNVSTMEEASGITNARQESLDIEKGPVFAALLLSLDNSQYLSLAAHALVVDSISWGIILRDTEDFLNHSARAHNPTPLGFREWCCSKLETEHGRRIEALPVLPADDAQKHSHRVTRMNVPIPSRLLGDTTKALRLSPSVLFQAIVLHAFSRAFECQELPLLTVQEDGRVLKSNRDDFTQTVGQFTTFLPLCVPSYGRSTFGEILRQTKETYQRACNGKTTHLIANHSQQPPLEKSMCAPLPNILFRFLPPCHEQQWSGSVFQPVVGEHPAYLHDAYPAEGIAVTVLNTENYPRIIFSGTLGAISETDLERWVRECNHSINEAVKTLEENTLVFTPCDFPLLALTKDDLQSLLHGRLPAIGINPNDVEAAYPCAPIQEGMLISQARQPEQYQMLFIWEVTSTGNHAIVDADRLQSAWLQLTCRHSILRTILVDGIRTCPFIQVVLDTNFAHTTVIQCVDEDDVFSTLSSNRHIGGQGRQSLPRFTICQTQDDKTLVAVEISHVLTDATSMGVLKRDLALAYNNKLPSTSAAHYGDYIAYLEGFRRRDAALEYWTEYLAGCTPCYFPRLNDAYLRADLAAEQRSVNVSFEYMSELHAFCNRTGLTISNVIQVAWGLVLRAFTGLDTVLFGYLASGRDVPLAGIEDAVGPYINMLVCRIDVNQSATLLDILHKVQRDFMQGVSLQHLPMTELFHSATDGGHGMFNTCITFPPEITGTEQSEECVIFRERDFVAPDEYDITVECGLRDGVFKASLKYSTITLSEKEASRVAHNLRQAMSDIIQQRGMPKDLPFLSAIDTQQLQQWNGGVPTRVERCVHGLIAEQCRAQPDTPAVCAWDGDFTYGELDRRSSALAAHLAGLGVGPEVFVPLLFEKSRWTAVAMLGVMKAGGAFVLLDPSHPRARLQGICRVISAQLVLASAQNTALSRELADRVVTVADGVQTWHQRNRQAAITPVDANNALYAVFTSGSTGVPKAAIIEHASFYTGVLAHATALRLGPEARVFQFSSYAFDNSISDTLSTLSMGGCVCVPSETDRKNNISAAIQKLRANLCFLTPTVSRVLQPADLTVGGWVWCSFLTSMGRRSARLLHPFTALQVHNPTIAPWGEVQAASVGW
ncbi:hypothetical protein CNMCM8980_002384 [Aspergillus fumigatiaffinis]|nr:hypothetical protein CNMCM8980_002384 [Aspergillus fumigatiaffinis]